MNKQNDGSFLWPKHYLYLLHLEVGLAKFLVECS